MFKYINNTLKTWNLLYSYAKSSFPYFLLTMLSKISNCLAIYVLESKVQVKVNYTCVYICVCICYTISLADYQLCFIVTVCVFLLLRSQLHLETLFFWLRFSTHDIQKTEILKYNSMKTEHCLCSDCQPKSEFFFFFFLAYQQINPWNVIFTI